MFVSAHLLYLAPTLTLDLLPYLHSTVTNMLIDGTAAIIDRILLQDTHVFRREQGRTQIYSCCEGADTSEFTQRNA